MRTAAHTPKYENKLGRRNTIKQQLSGGALYVSEVSPISAVAETELLTSKSSQLRCSA